VSQDEKERRAEELIDDWIEGRLDLNDVAWPAQGESREQDVLRLFLAAHRASPPEMSSQEAERVFDRVRSKLLAQGSGSSRPARHWLMWAAGIAALAAGFAAWSTWRFADHTGPAGAGVHRVTVKEVRFESLHNGKVVRFEMQVYRTQQERKEVLHVPTP